METFFAKWLGDLRRSQRPDGSIPGIAPDLREEEVPSDPVWGAAVQRVLLGHWLTYGDTRVVEDNIGMLRAWVDFQLSCADGDGVIGLAPISYGHDWLALDQTPPRLLQTAATMDSLAALAELESAVGNHETAEFRLVQREGLREAAVRTFVEEERGSVGNGSQASLAIAVWAGWLTGDAVDRALDRLEADVRARGNRLSAGFAATRTVVRTLAENGRSQVIFDMLRGPRSPQSARCSTMDPGQCGRTGG
jgi:alpha-L-rhamnosidase